MHRPDHLRRIGPLRHQNEDFQYYFVDPAQPAEKVEYILRRMLEPYIRDGQTDLWLDRRSQTVSEVARLARLACIISSLIGEAPELVLEYAEHCFNYGVQLSDAIHLLEVSFPFLANGIIISNLLFTSICRQKGFKATRF